MLARMVFCTSNLQPFLDELHDLRNELTELFSAADQNAGSFFIPAECSVILFKMKGYINEKKYEEINKELNKLECLDLNGPLKDEIEEIRDAIIVMDYDSVMEKIKKLLS